MTNRGLITDNNTGYLYLIDGHPLTDIINIGYYEPYRLPLLEKVKRIEIVRGPGSTLWGSDASMAIINIITKDGASLDQGEKKIGKFKMTYNYEYAFKQHILDISYGKKWSEAQNIYFSFNYANNEAPWTNGRIAGPEGLYQPKNLWFTMNKWDYEPSYDIFLKYRNDDILIEANYNNYGFMEPFYTPISHKSDGTLLGDRFWTELSYSPQITDNIKLEINIRGDIYGRTLKQRKIKDGSIIRGEINEVKTLGMEALFRYNQPDMFNVLFGVFSNYSKWKRTFFPKNNNLGGNDKNYAVFTEGEYSAINNLILILGMRWESNQGRVKTQNLLPRFSAIYNVSQRLSVKYAYNTGYVRFGTSFSDAYIPGPPGKYYTKNIADPQESRSHDLQLNYRNNTLYASATIFLNKISSIPAYVGKLGPEIGRYNGLPVYYGILGVGNFNTFGFELDSKFIFSNRLNVYGNFSYQHGRWEKRYPFDDPGKFDLVEHTNNSTTELEPTVVPTYIWNLGMNYSLLKTLQFSIHYNGWSRAHVVIKTNPKGFETVYLQNYVDVNINYIHRNWLKFSIYSKNIFDNPQSLPNIKSGYIDQYFRRQIGVKLEVRF